MEQKRTIQTIFSDYKTEANIKKAEIKEMNLIKKQNILELSLENNEYIEIKELWFFEKFLKDRFGFSNVDMKLQYQENTEIKSVEKEWTNLICYMVHKYPLMKPMILLKSTIEIEKNNINVNMKIKGSDFLRARKLDKELERVIKFLGFKSNEHII